MTAVLGVGDLRVVFATDDGPVRAVDGVSFEVARSEVLAIVGESGCGKSVTAQTLIGLTRFTNATITGSVIIDGRDLNTLPDRDLQKIRGARIAMVFQDPMTSLNPVYRVGDQIVEAIRAHRSVPKSAALDRAVELLGMVGIPCPQRRIRDYPHEFSGGMRQRVMIAMALALEPEVLIADEPTTALDVTIKHFPIKAGVLVDREVARVRAVDGVSFTLREGETLGLVGESGCGKSTVCRAIMQLVTPTSGSVLFAGQELVGRSARELRPLRREIQMIFQDPFSSLNPRKRVGQIVGDPLELHGLAKGSRLEVQVQELLERVGLQAEHYNRYPHEFSGGQRQRIGIARAVGLRPRLIIADEPVSALDVSVQAQIINLLDDLQREFSMAYLFVAHDLGVVRHVSDRVAVMYLGKIVEEADATDLYGNPRHPYTQALLSAVPIPDPRENAVRQRITLGGDVPSPIDPPPGCRFHTRCPRATEVCRSAEPPLLGDGHVVACHHPG